MEQSKRILGFGVGIVVALLAVTFFMAGNFSSTTNAAGSGPEMTLTVKDGGTCDGSECTVPLDGAFTLSVEIITAPADYVLAQSYIEFGPDLTYNVTDAIADELSWADCNTSVALRDQQTATSVLHGCLTGLLPPLPVSNYTGNMIDLSMNCSSANSNTEVQLLPEGDPVALTNGALFKLGDDTPVIPKVSNLTVICGAGAPAETPTTGPTGEPTVSPTTGPTEEATDTPVPPTVGPTSTPSPRTCGDVDGDGSTTSIDALQTLWLVAGLISATARNADINGDGQVTSVDAALILQIVADLYSCD